MCSRNSNISTGWVWITGRKAVPKRLFFTVGAVVRGFSFYALFTVRFFRRSQIAIFYPLTPPPLPRASFVERAFPRVVDNDTGEIKMRKQPRDAGSVGKFGEALSYLDTVVKTRKSFAYMYISIYSRQRIKRRYSRLTCLRRAVEFVSSPIGKEQNLLNPVAFLCIIPLRRSSNNVQDISNSSRFHSCSFYVWIQSADFEIDIYPGKNAEARQKYFLGIYEWNAEVFVKFLRQIPMKIYNDLYRNVNVCAQKKVGFHGMHTCRMNYRETFLKLTDSSPRSDVGNFRKEGKEIFKLIHMVHTYTHEAKDY